VLSTSDIYKNPRRLVAGDSSFDHAFGGPFSVLDKKYGNLPFHLLFDLDLRDPLLSFLSLNKDAERLPFIFPLCSDGADIAYEVLPNGAVKLLGKRTYRPTKKWPYQNYPTYFKRVPVNVVPYSYEEYRAAIFSYAVGPHNLRKDDQNLLRAIGRGVTQLGGVQELPFGEPQRLYCPNPGCYWHENCCSMRPLASMWNSPMPGVNLWGDDVDVNDRLFYLQ